MNIIQIVIFGLVTTIIVVTVKQQRPDIALLISLAGGTVILIFVVSSLSVVIETISNLFNKSNMDSVYITTILKVIGIAYLADFGAQLCKDAGESAIAAKIELGGKILILLLAIPILTALMELILKILT
ncbi:MAG: stage III sporulation protein AD [Clostridiales bacterium]|nr:stage III sporulation protein AD [Clostridia bacterium]MDI9513221.1 stage III sporulation protein AD [Bacillota bacterium]NLH59057.1 stage III sporulation protein AD [Clostridiales bacterium]